jgi:UDP-N-acetylmuramoyl-L-alanine---L-glutamate ligase
MLSLQSRILLLGFGREGEATLQWLTARGFQNIKVFDDNPLKMKNVPSGLAADSSSLNQTDIVIVTPGVPRNHSLLKQARMKCLLVTTATNLFLEKYASKTIGVTGSKGKSTTSSLIFHIIKSQGLNVAYGGNIGTPLLSLPEADFYVAELSSYQNSYLTVHPKVAVVTSLFPDHLDWHGGVEQYYKDKLNIIGEDTKDIILNTHDSILMDTLEYLKVANPHVYKYAVEKIDDETYITRLGEKIVNVRELALIGQHNYINICLALEAVEAIIGELNIESLKSDLTTFKPLEHRLQIISGYRHIYVDDTLATTPHSTAASLKALRHQYPEEYLYLIVGGFDRGLDSYTILADAIMDVGKVTVLTIPENGKNIAEYLPDGVKVLHCPDLDGAVKVASGLPEGLVILSPAAPSYGVYNNYEAKSKAFIELIQKYGERRYE